MFRSLGLVLSLSIVYIVPHVSSLYFGNNEETCSYKTLCPSEIKINEPCNKYPPCRYITVNLPCHKTENCTAFYEPWTACTKTCDGGLRERLGRCCAPSCTKKLLDVEECNTQSCNNETAVDGMYSSWSTWVELGCSETCCGGVTDRNRTRECNNPPPSGGGADCVGDALETDTNFPCNTQYCPVVCNPGDVFKDNPCETCTPTYFICNGTTPIETSCIDPFVFSPTFNACIPDNICT